MQDTFILHQKHFHVSYSVMLSQMSIYVTYKVQNRGEGQYSFSLLEYNKFNVQIRHFW